MAIETAKRSLVGHLRALRYRESGQTIEQKAHLVGLTRQELYDLTGEDADPNPKLPRIIAIAMGLGISVDELLGSQRGGDDAVAMPPGVDILERRIDDISAAAQELRQALAAMRPTTSRV